jgi:profilin
VLYHPLTPITFNVGKKGTAGVVLVRTGQAILIGVYNESAQPGNATNTVEKLADYLIENGY